MKSMLIILMVAFALSAAMVSRDRRALSPDTTVETTTPLICAAATPCAWSLAEPYRISIDEPDKKIENSYCKCPSNLVCTEIRDDSVANAYVHRCKLPDKDSTTAASSLTDES